MGRRGLLDRAVEELLELVLMFVEDGRVVPIIGEELLRVRQDGVEIPLYHYVAKRLAERLEIPPEKLPADPDLNAVVCCHIAAGGLKDDVYPKIRVIMREAEARFDPPEPLLQLAGIDRFSLFVVLTFDSLMAAAIDRVRFQGERRTQELAYSLSVPADLPAPHAELRTPIVYHLLGKVSSEPDYVVSEEDTLEFVHHMQSKGRGAARLVFDALRDNHLLFLGCTFPDWLERFLIRIPRLQRLSHTRTRRELLVGNLAERDADLVVFLRHFSKETKIISFPAGEFVAQLAARYRQGDGAGEGRQGAGAAGFGKAGHGESDAMEDGAFFLSYASEDLSAVRRLHDFLENDAGVPAWFDKHRLEVGDDWERQLRRNIRKCSYFVPVISAAAARRRDGIYRKEWAWANDRAAEVDEDMPFILPVAIDDTPENSQGIPEYFGRKHWTRVPGGEGDEGFRRRIVSLYRDYRKRMRG